MLNLSKGRVPAAVGRGVVAAALVGLMGYGVGLTQASQAVVSAQTPPVSLQGAPAATSYAQVVDAVTPAVVTVHVEKRASIVPTQMPEDPFGQFFGRGQQGPRQQQRTPHQSGLGSGVITTPDGYILTNNHVIDGVDSVRVELADNRMFDAKVVGTDPASDVAVLKIEGSHLPTIPIGDSSRVRVGDVVLAVGNPLGVGQTVTMGIISAKGRATGVGDGSYEDFLQTDAPINQGNSGGALVNLKGELVGINSQILTPTGGNIGLGFAIPANMVRAVMDQLKTHGVVTRAKLGVTVQGMTADIAESMQLADARGALVSGVEPGSPAARAGLQRGDVITALDDEKVLDSNALRNRIAGTTPGSTMAVTVVRGGRAQTLHATLGTLEATRKSASAGESESSSGRFGMSVEPLTPDIASQLGVGDHTAGVVVRDVDPEGLAAAAGIKPGDVISQVDGHAVKTPSDLKSALDASSDRPALLLVTRDNADTFVPLRHPRS